ncbi:esterase-like activity of phytase family protein [Novipirellula artificiosorum]|uniref:Phytase-like domain-containing protein n=1 Tax=Novipirellula artificiosorum TaxID=2528016 RepID=A0A5C6DW26_9BACT|nr:esterase-like activity of phytase family protein [Novipirellula artificiosorum]TWU40555.1 hypothetical protein Poly41_13880 [Novipirellula artificiosorum]
MKFKQSLVLLFVVPGIVAALTPADLGAEAPAASHVATTRRSSHPKGGIELIGVVRLDGTMHDKSGLTQTLEDGSESDRFGGLSAMDYTGVGDRFLLLADRGVGDGEVTYPCRFHEADLVVDPASKTIHFQLIATRMLSTFSGAPVVGSLIAHDADLHTANGTHIWTAMDPEGVRRLSDGSILICDEYGPHLVIADVAGQIKSELEIPERFRLKSPIGGIYQTGVYPNRGLEGVAVSPSQKRFMAILQSPLVQDAMIRDGKCLGLNCRCIVLDAVGKSGFVEREYDYRLDDLANCVSEVLAIDEDRYLVLERDGRSGSEAKSKRIYLVDTALATDVAGIESMPSEAVPERVLPVSKRLWLDLLDPQFGLGGDLAAEKPEGICWGKTLPDGRRTLWVCCDNDFEPAHKSEIYCFAIDTEAIRH